MQTTHRLDFNSIPHGTHWAEHAADQVIALHPNQEIYTTAAGISPSGVVHFGNFRDIVTANLVRNTLVAKGKNARLIFSWDNFDRFRKVPAGVPVSFEQYIGMPLTQVPDPLSELGSYAERYQAPFETAMEQLGIEIEYRDQTKLHQSGIYDEAIFHALKHRKEIADIQLSFMSEKAKSEKNINADEYRENYYPISIYSKFTGKDSTKILNYDGEKSVTYLCAETKQTETVDLSVDHIAKLAWKVDWPMRWKHEGVCFEPGGHDHASPGGSYDVSSRVASEIFNYPAPVFAEYKFVGIQGLGAKMSGSKGNAVSPADLLDIYEPALLNWLYARKAPNQSFELAFNSEIYRQYEEYDTTHPEQNNIPFRQVVGFGQVVQWDIKKLQTILEMLGHEYDEASIARRIPLAQNWLARYNPEEIIALLETRNDTYIADLEQTMRSQVTDLHTALVENSEMTLGELEALVYTIPKKYNSDETLLKKEQRSFFKSIYNLLIAKDTGPRLGTFLWAADRNTVLQLLQLHT